MQIGVDVGGTSIVVGLVDDEGRIVARVAEPFPTGAACERVGQVIAAMSNTVAAQAGVRCGECASLGIAAPGSLDKEKETILHAYNLQLHDAPLRAVVARHVPGVPVLLANDADTAAVAELFAGALKGCMTAVMLTIGTGLGSGIILQGKLFAGGRNNGSEIGHMVLQQGGRLCTCGVEGCAEALCSASYLESQGRQSIVEYPKSMIHTKAKGDMQAVDAKLVIDCAREGDKIARHIYDQFIDHWGSAVVSLIHILDPEVIAIGGGVSSAGEFFFQPLRENIANKVFFKRDYAEVVAAQMGNDAGVIGAAMLKKFS